MTLLLPDPRPRVAPEQQAKGGGTGVPRLGGADLDAAEVLGADVAVLGGTEQANRRPVVAVEGATAEAIGEEHAIGQRILDGDDRPVPVEATEHDVGDHRALRKDRCDDAVVEDLELDPLPPQVGGGPAGHTVEVGVELSPGQRGQGGERDLEGVDASSLDLDGGMGRDDGRRPAQVLAEAGEPFDQTLAWRKLPDQP